jgi:hypothetical protein
MEGVEEVAPKRPIALPFVVIRSHDPSVDVCPRSSEKISELSLSLTRKIRHESFCKGNEVAKDCKNWSSERRKVSDVADSPRNVREATSAIVLSTPAMESEIRGEASLAWMRRASARVSLLATIDRELLNLFVQLTVGVLSHHAAT